MKALTCDMINSYNQKYQNKTRETTAMKAKHKQHLKISYASDNFRYTLD